MTHCLVYTRLWRTVGILMIVAVIVGSLANVSVPVTAPGFDKWQHLAAYACLMLWWGMLQPQFRMAWAVALLLLGAALELAQSLIRYRTMEYADMLANLLGVVLALVLLKTAVSSLLGRLDRHLANRLDARAP